MKKIFFLTIIISILIISANEIKAKVYYAPKDNYYDTTTSDTVRFFRNLINHQLKYEGQPLSVLLKDIPYTVRSYGAMLGSPLSICPGIMISVLNDKITFREGNNYNKIAVVEVFFHTTVPSSDIQKLSLKNPYGWGRDEIEYFSPIIIDSIGIWKSQ